MRGAWIWCLALFLSARPAAGQTAEPPSAEDLSVQAFVQAVETSISTMDRERWSALLSSSIDREQALEFFEVSVPQGITRVVVKERDRGELAATATTSGYRLVLEVFVETGPRGRIATWNVDVRKPSAGDAGRQPWRITALELLSAVDGLHRLVLHTGKQFAAKNLVLKSVDFEVRLPAGQVFVAETPEGVTGLVLLGDGSIFFSPKPKEERGQVRIFCGAEDLDTPFSTAFIRLSPFEYRQLEVDSMLAPVEPIDVRARRRAQQVFDDEIGNSFSLDLSDLSRDTWSLLPQPGDFVAEIRSRRYDKLTFARSTNEPEDVSLFQRAHKRNIALYASEQKLASRGRFYNEDDLTEYDVLEYSVDAAFTPEREWLQGRTRIKLRVESFALGALTLKLADALTVNSVVSEQFGRLLFLRVANQNAFVVNLPSPVAKGFEMTLYVSYQGRLERQGIQDDSVATSADSDPQGSGRAVQPEDIPLVNPEEHYLFSNRAHWYPQAQVTDYATATMRLTVPQEFAIVASGVRQGPPVRIGMQVAGQPSAVLYTFTAVEPIRYLSMVVSRMQQVESSTVTLTIEPPPSTPATPAPPAPATPAATNGKPQPAIAPVGSRNTIALTIDANRRQESRARESAGTIADVVRLYASYTGDVPYNSLHVAMVEANLPGGHAPGYVAVINNPLPTTPFTWRNDPASFGSFPEFFLAHEIAHQWFGQAVGWKNYHEQWLSEGFAQYMAALFARERRGDEAFRDILRQFRRWSLERSNEGPIHLGYRLGHIKGESRVFRALVYNKGAMVLHMLRRFIGDEAFFNGVRRYYREHRFAKAGTDDLKKAMEAESGRDLQRFFERWVFDSGIPRVRYSTAIAADEVSVRLEQSGDVYDMPVTVSVQYADGKVEEQVVVLTEAVTEAKIPVKGAVRSVEVNQDNAALAQFDRPR